MNEDRQTTGRDTNNNKEVWGVNVTEFAPYHNQRKATMLTHVRRVGILRSQSLSPVGNSGLLNLFFYVCRVVSGYCADTRVILGDSLDSTREFCVSLTKRRFSFSALTHGSPLACKLSPSTYLAHYCIPLHIIEHKGVLYEYVT